MYSVIEHLSCVLSLANWEGVPLTMLTTAFDVSEQQPERRYLVMAGFISEAKVWTEFDELWRRRLALDGLTYFHANPLAQSQGEYKGWDKQPGRAEALLADLVDIITAQAFRKFGIVVQSDTVPALADIQQIELTMIRVAGSIIVGEVEEWAAREKYRIRPEYVFEDGDRDQKTLRYAVKRITGVSPSFRFKRDNPKRKIIAFTPLQAADLLAYLLKKVEDAQGPLPQDYRFILPYQNLEKMLGQPKVFNLESVNDLEPFLRAFAHRIGPQNENIEE